MELWLVPGISVLAILFALFPGSNILKRATGTPEMQTISNAFEKGAAVFHRRQNKTIGKPEALAFRLFILCGFNTVIYSKNR